MLSAIKSIMLFFSLFTCKEPVYLSASSEVKYPVKPADALRLAQPFLPANGTFIWRDEAKAKVHIVLYGKRYYIKKTDYPAKTMRYYMQPAVVVHAQTGKISFRE